MHHYVDVHTHLSCSFEAQLPGLNKRAGAIWIIHVVLSPIICSNAVFLPMVGFGFWELHFWIYIVVLGAVYGTTSIPPGFSFRHSVFLFAQKSTKSELSTVRLIFGRPLSVSLGANWED